MKKDPYLLITLFAGFAFAGFLAGFLVPPSCSAQTDAPLRLEKVYVDYIAAMDAIRQREVAAEDDEAGDKRVGRIIQLDVKIDATKYCLSALRKEFGIAPAATGSP